MSTTHRYMQTITAVCCGFDIHVAVLICLIGKEMQFVYIGIAARCMWTAFLMQVLNTLAMLCHIYQLVAALS